MPQMAPMMWCGLFFYFILLALILMKLVFFESFSDSCSKESKKEFIKLNWKW